MLLYCHHGPKYAALASGQVRTRRFHHTGQTLTSVCVCVPSRLAKQGTWSSSCLMTVNDQVDVDGNAETRTSIVYAA